MALPASKKSRRHQFVHEAFEPGTHVKKLMAMNKIEVCSGAGSMIVDSHCAGADAPAFALKLLGLPHKNRLVSEACPKKAMLHRMHHDSKHILVDVGSCKDRRGPCYKHGSMCDWRDTPVTLMCGSFVCGPYSNQNPKRSDPDYDPKKSPGDCKKADTFHHCRDAICEDKPKFFILENVDGVKNISKGMEASPLQWMLDDPAFGLRTQCKGYSVEAVTGVRATSVGLPQERPRTLFFGARNDSGSTARTIANDFQGFIKEAETMPVHHIDQFQKHTRSTIAPTPALCAQEYSKDHVDYCTALMKAMEGAVQAKLLPSNTQMPESTQRPSASAGLRSTSVRARATADVLDLVLVCEIEKLKDAGDPVIDAHPVGDISQSVGPRRAWRLDGCIPTLLTGSLIYDFKNRCLLDNRDLLGSMGYPEVNLSFVTPAVQRTMVGNAFAVPASALAIAACALAGGHMMRKP